MPKRRPLDTYHRASPRHEAGEKDEAMTSLIDSDRCPKCGDAIDDGYGLAFGGFGAYRYCLNQACDWHVKDRECPVCEAVDCKEHE